MSECEGSLRASQESSADGSTGLLSLHIECLLHTEAQAQARSGLIGSVVPGVVAPVRETVGVLTAGWACMGKEPGLTSHPSCPVCPP